MVRTSSKEHLASIILGGTIVWLGSAYILQRSTFTWTSYGGFDWAGLVYIVISIIVAAYGLHTIRAARGLLRQHYLWYAAAWIIFIALLSIGAGETRRGYSAQQASLPQNQCVDKIFPSICRNQSTATIVTSVDNSSATIPPGKIIQAGNVALYILYVHLFMIVYGAMKKRVKGYRHEELFQ